MPEELSFRDLIQQIRDGSSEAAAELLRRYESELRIMARVRLTDPSMRRVMDSMDICQSIMANFFVRAASGDFELDTPEQLMKLLATMFRNKVVTLARKQRAQRRDVRRTAGTSVEEMAISDGVETPSVIVSARELLTQFDGQLTDDERLLVQRRRDGFGWAEIAAELGESAEAIRKRHARAVARAAAEIGIDT